MRAKVSDLIRPELRALEAYHVPEPGGMIKLNAMENPYRWPEPLVDEWLNTLRDVELNRYPDAGASALKTGLREHFSLPPEAPLVLGNGSDEIIQLILLTLRSPDCLVLAPEPTFVMYRHSSLAAGVAYESVPLGADFGLSHNVTLDAIAKHKPAVVFLAYPNNPTGNLFDRKLVDEIIEATPGLVVVDEAYAPFAEQSFLGEAGRCSNLLVMRTLSKFGLAGLRLGFLTGPAQWLTEMEKLRLPYNINGLTQASAEFALRHREVFDRQTAEICANRERLFTTLESMEGITPFPSAANFILFRTAEGSADQIHESLLAHGVLIKNLNHTESALEDCLRVTVGTAAEIEAFLAALTASI